MVGSEAALKGMWREARATVQEIGTGRATVVIPAYNESASIGSVVEAVLRAGYQVVVVDDGSRDEAAAAASAAGAYVARHAVNLGQGAALQTGIEIALRRGAEFILTFDADGQHRPDVLEALMAPLRAGQADFTLGSRGLGAMVGAPMTRRLLVRLAAWFTRATTGAALSDAHNGLRGMTRTSAFARTGWRTPPKSSTRS
jgi:glycosyltransferase involved in cell wall biosynthesis